jgi:hypothetical protein
LRQPVYDIDEQGAALPASGRLRFGLRFSVIGYGYWGPQLARI